MRILICGIMPARAYSGGRYHAYMMAQAFAVAGHEVVFWTNNLPIFLDDFEGRDESAAVKFHLSSDFSDEPSGDWDWVWIVPHKNPPVVVFKRALQVAYKAHAKVGFLNFETPNWIAKTADHGLDQEAWAAWALVSPCIDIILSSSYEGEKHAREYFVRASAAQHVHINPPINDRAADLAKVSGDKVQSDRKTVVCITRFGGPHGYKGGREILDYAGSSLSGHRLIFIVGTQTISEGDLAAYRQWGLDHDVHVEFLYRISDAEKFGVLHQADLMVFLSRFEGFGYPPIEARYCGLPCIAYDLPVLKEVSGDELTYVSLEDPNALGPTLADAIGSASRLNAPSAGNIGLGFDAYSQKIRELLGTFDPNRCVLDSVLDEDFDRIIASLESIDSAAMKKAVRNVPGLRVRFNRSVVGLLAKLFASLPLLRRLAGQALLTNNNFHALMIDQSFQQLFLENKKTIYRVLRQNPAHLRHLMLSPQGREIIPEVIDLVSNEAPATALDQTSTGEARGVLDPHTNLPSTRGLQ